LSTPPPTEAETSAARADDYRLVSILHTSPPNGTFGNDWHAYKIAQGPNMIRGYRRGTIARVTEDVEHIVASLNERRRLQRGRVHLTPPRRAADRTADRDEP
jgi:hypothetical protein